MSVFPSLVSNDPEEIKKLDYFLCLIKTYEIETSFESLKHCIAKNKTTLPLYNGVDATERR